jgi:EAL domain-containing protein (putative c-di-GMP-specific phosphodiesterase class I)
VLRTACRELVRLRKAGHDDFTMSVNVSQVQFRHPHFLEMLRAALATIPARRHSTSSWKSPNRWRWKSRTC